MALLYGYILLCGTSWIKEGDALAPPEARQRQNYNKAHTVTKWRSCIWGFPKIRGTILGVPIIRIIVFWGLYWVTLILGNYHMKLVSSKCPAVAIQAQSTTPVLGG